MSSLKKQHFESNVGEWSYFWLFTFDSHNLGVFILFRLNSLVMLKCLLININYLFLLLSQLNICLFCQILPERTPHPVNRRPWMHHRFCRESWTQHTEEWIELRVEQDDKNKHGIQWKIVLWDLDFAVLYKCMCPGKMCWQYYEKLFMRIHSLPAVNS